MLYAIWGRSEFLGVGVGCSRWRSWVSGMSRDPRFLIWAVPVVRGALGLGRGPQQLRTQHPPWCLLRLYLQCLLLWAMRHAEQKIERQCGTYSSSSSSALLRQEANQSRHTIRRHNVKRLPLVLGACITATNHQCWCRIVAASWRVLQALHLGVYYRHCLLACITGTASWRVLQALHLGVYYRHCILACTTGTVLQRTVPQMSHAQWGGRQPRHDSS
jgi:hypothetical protein